MRKTKSVTVTFEGRDKGKTFLITEMSASQAERFALRAFLALAHSGVQIPEEVTGAGLAGLAYIGLSALFRVNFHEIEPLMTELMDCVQIKPDPKRPDIVRGIIEDDIDEAVTRAWLKSEAFELLTGFSPAAAILNRLAAENLDQIFGHIPTSPGSLVQ